MINWDRAINSFVAGLKKGLVICLAIVSVACTVYAISDLTPPKEVSAASMDDIIKDYTVFSSLEVYNLGKGEATFLPYSY